jgi:hypothetical protein
MKVATIDVSEEGSEAGSGGAGDSKKGKAARKKAAKVAKEKARAEEIRAEVWPLVLSLVCYLPFSVYCLLSAASCLLSAACCLLSAVCSLLSPVSCLLSSVCGLLSAAKLAKVKARAGNRGQKNAWQRHDKIATIHHFNTKYFYGRA